MKTYDCLISLVFLGIIVVKNKAGRIDPSFQQRCRNTLPEISISEALSFLGNGKRATPRACCEESPCEHYKPRCNTEQFRSLILDHYRWTCRPGQSVRITNWCLSHIGHECTDIDECVTNYPCDAANTVSCENTPGSYRCHCKPGFTGTRCEIATAIDCTTTPDGTYDIGCKSYTQCQAGALIQHDCPLHQVYSATKGKCDYESNVPPPCGLVRDCSNIPDKSYTDLTRNCTSYYTCVHHIYYGHNYCTPGTVFEETMQTCVWPRDAFAPCGTKTVT